jgi:succinate dehydrogenase/fumarate reductase flavoprotein subunit
VPALNGLYKDYRLYGNFFQPVLKLQSKTRVDARVRKVYGEAQTPYWRVFASASVSDQGKANLTTLYEQLDPVTLKEKVDRCQREIQEKSRVRFLAEAATPAKQDT